VIEDIRNLLLAEETETPTKVGNYSADLDDLWSPKKIQPYVLSDTCGEWMLLLVLSMYTAYNLIV
jgi:hypothetical protein